MYSYEIDFVLKSRNYCIDSSAYLQICKSSPQISQIRYDSFENIFEIWTDDNYYWKFVTRM